MVSDMQPGAIDGTQSVGLIASLLLENTHILIRSHEVPRAVLRIGKMADGERYNWQHTSDGSTRGDGNNLLHRMSIPSGVLSYDVTVSTIGISGHNRPEPNTQNLLHGSEARSSNRAGSDDQGWSTNRPTQLSSQACRDRSLLSRWVRI